MNKVTIAIAIGLIATSISTAELIGTFPLGGGNMTIEPTGFAIQAGGLEFVAEPGILTQGASAAPFAFFIPNSAAPGNVTFGSLGTSVTIDGPLELDMIVSSDATGADISATWGNGVVPTPFPINGFGGVNGRLRGNYPYDGGPVSISPSGDMPVSAHGLLLRTEGRGSLTSGGNPAPFTNLGENTANRWSVSSTEEVLIDGLITLDVSAAATTSFFGDTFDGEGTRTSSFQVTRQAPLFSTELEGSYTLNNSPIRIRPTTGPLNLRGLEISAPFGLRGGTSAAPFESLDQNAGRLWKVSSNADILIDGAIELDVRPGGSSDINGIFFDGTTSSSFAISQRTSSARIQGTFPYDGGPVTIDSIAGRTASLESLSLEATAGILTGGGSAAPFETLTSTTKEQWSVSSNSPVTIDGTVVLDVVASTDAIVGGTANDGWGTLPFSVSRQQPELTPNLVADFARSTGPVRIRSVGGPVITRGLDFQASRGRLTGGGSAAPYETLSNNTPSRWTANSSSDVTIDGSVILDLAATSNSQLQAFATEGSTTKEVEVVRRDSIGLAGSFPFFGGPITISGSHPVSIRGLEISTTRGTLAGGGSAAPFANLETNTENNWHVNSEADVTVDGSVVLDVAASTDAFATGRAYNDIDEAPFRIVRERPAQTNALEGSFPFNGGAVTVRSTDAPVSLRGLEIESRIGPIAGGGSAAPFDELTTNTAQRWRAQSAADVTIDGDVTLDLTTTGGSSLNGYALKEAVAEKFDIREEAPTGPMLKGSFANKGGPITIAPTAGPISMLGVELRTVTGSLTGGGSPAPFETLLSNEPDQWTAGSLARVTVDGPITLDVVASEEAELRGFWGNGASPLAFDVESTNPARNLVGSFPYDGGPVTISTLPGSSPVLTRGLDINAETGTLSGGGSAAPYETLANNTAQRWTANSAADVSIDGSVTLDLSASTDAVLGARASSADDAGSFDITRNDPLPSDRLVGSYPFGGGSISLRSIDDPVSLRKLSISGPSSRSLIPGTNPAPFETRTAADDRNWAVESSTDVVIDGIVTLDVATRATGIRPPNFSGQAFDGSITSSFEIFQRTQNGLLQATYPTSGGPVALEAIVPSRIQGMELTARRGTLTGGGSAAPFDVVDANTSERWAVSSSAPFTLDGRVVLDVEASANADLEGSWNDDFGSTPLTVFGIQPQFTSQVSGTVAVGGGPIIISASRRFASRSLDLTTSFGTLTGGDSASPFETVETNTSTHWSALSSSAVNTDGPFVLDVVASEDANVLGIVRDASNTPFRFGVSRSSATLRGSFDYDGGPVTIRSVDGPVAANGLTLNAVSGSVTGGGNPAPFDTIGTNTANEWSANSSAYVIFDGSVELDVMASRDANLRGEYTDGANTRPISLTRSRPTFTSKLIGEFPFEGGPITIKPGNEPVVTRGLDFNAKTGTLTGGGSAAPYESITNNAVSRWTVESSTDVLIDGPVELDVLASADAQFDAFVNNGSITNRFTLGRTAPDGGNSPLIGSFPAEGGNITVTPTQGPIAAGGIEFVAAEGDLTQGASAAPFAFFIPNNAFPGNVLLGSLGSPVTIDGPVELNVAARADASIEASWGDGVTPRPFPVSNRPFVGGTESKLVGSIPFDGGAVSISPRGEPVTTRGLNIEATSGSLSGGGSAAPYETLVSNTAQKWTVESNTDVTIDGPIELDVAASKAARLVGAATKVDGIEPIAFSRENPASTDRIFGSYPAGGGPISIAAPNGPVSTRSLDLQAPSTSTLSSGGSAAPYERVVTDNSKRWTATSTADVVIDGVVTLDVSASDSRRNTRQFTGLVTDGSTTSQFAVVERQPIAGLTATYPYDGGPLTLAGNGQQISTLDITASAGLLTGGGNASPLSTISANTDQQWAVASDVSVLIDGLITLDVIASADAQLAGAVSNEFDNAEILVRRLGPNLTSSLVGNFEYAGGPVSLTSVDGPVSIRSLQLSASQGGLTGGTTATPFDSVVTNTASHWIAESLASVLVDGTVELSVQAEPGSVINGIFNDGTETLAFSVSRTGFDPGFDFGGNFEIAAYYPPWGGRVVLVTSGDPVALGGVELVAEPGVLTQGASAEPFAFFIPNGSAPGNVTFGSLGTPVTVDGFLELDVFVAAGTPAGAISATWGNGVTPTAFAVLPLSTIPEPSSNLMICLGLIGSLAVRRRKLSKQPES